MNQETTKEPIFNVPSVVLISLALLIAIYGLQIFMGPSFKYWTIINLSFLPLRYLNGAAFQEWFQWLWTPVTYSLLHGNSEHLFFNGVWLVIFATPVARQIGTIRYLLLWAFSSAASAFFYMVLIFNDGDRTTILVGASGVISALAGACCRFAFPDPQRSTEQATNPVRLSLREALSNRTALALALFWLGGNALMALFASGLGSSNIAWTAHIGGFLFGLLFFPLFDRPPAKNTDSSQNHSQG